MLAERDLVHLADSLRPVGDRYPEDFLVAVLPAGEVVEHAAQVELEPLPRLVSSTCSFVASRATDLNGDTRDTLVLLTTELVTNAIIHARTALRVGVIVSANYIVVTVHDLDLGRSEMNPELRDGGRGLMVVEALADAWAIRRDKGGGKTAWFRLHFPSGLRSPQGACDGYDEETA